MAKYSLTITTDSVDDVQRLAILAAIVTYGDTDQYDYPPLDDILGALDWVFVQILEIGDFAYETEEMEEIFSFIERKILHSRATLAKLASESMTSA